MSNFAEKNLLCWFSVIPTLLKFCEVCFYAMDSKALIQRCLSTLPNNIFFYKLNADPTLLMREGNESLSITKLKE
jgi:hypothetical protein